MLKIKKGYGCGIRAKLAWNSGAEISLRKSSYLSVRLRLPDDTIQVISDCAYDEYINTVIIRLSELSIVGQYAIVINVQDTKGQVLSNVLESCIEVTETAIEEFKNVTLDLTMFAVDTPNTAQAMGASPTIGNNGTWLVYNDTIKAYENSGVHIRDTAKDQEQDLKFADLGEQIEDNTSAIATEVTNRKSADDALMGRIDAIVGENASSAIDNFNEILAFLNGVKDTESLTTLLEAIRQKIRIAEEIGKSAQKLASAAQDTANQAKSYGESALTGLGNEATNRKAEDAKLNAAIGELSNTLTERINVIIGENASSAIDNFNEILQFLNGLTDSSSLLAILNLLREDITSNTNSITTLQELHKTIFLNSKRGIDINTLEKGIYILVTKRIVDTDPISPSGEVATLQVVNIKKSEADSTIYKGGFLLGYCSINSEAKIIPSTKFGMYKFDGALWSDIVTSGGGGIGNNCGLTVEDAGAGWYNILKDGIVMLTVQSEAEFDRFEGALNSVIADINDRLSMHTDDINTLENELNNVKEDLTEKAEISNVYNKNEINTKIEELVLSSSNLVIIPEERKIGIYRMGSKNYDVFEKTITLNASEIPLTLDANKIFSIGNQSVRDLYFDIANVNIWAINDSNKKLVSSNYKCDIIVDTEGMPAMQIECISPIVGSISNVTITVRYIKGLISFKTMKFTIPKAQLNITTVDDFNVELPVMMYDKRFAIISDSDDALSAPYNLWFKYAHAKWVDYNKTYKEFLDDDTNGAKSPKNTIGGETGERILCSTDGCGNNVPFKFGSSWVSYNNNKSDGIHDDASFPYQYISWRELDKFLDFGNGISNHGGGDQTNVLESIKMNEDRVEEKTGHRMFVFATPGGTVGYEDAVAVDEDYIGLRTNDTKRQWLNYRNITKADIMAKALYYRHFDDEFTFAEFKEKADYAYNANIPTIFFTGKHAMESSDMATPGSWENMKAFLDYVYDTYGKEGNDSVWYCCYAEFVEHLFTAKFSTITKEIIDDNVVITLNAAMLPNFYFNQVSLVLYKVGDIANVNQINCDCNVSHFLSYNSINGKLLINNYFNIERALSLAEKYTSLYESKLTDESKYDAIFLISRLNAILAAPFLARLNDREVAPTLNSIFINGGASTTYTQQVNVSLNVSGPYTHYKISESEGLSSCEWIESAMPIAFMLSSGFAKKSIYVQVKNSFGESGVKSSNITYADMPLVTHTINASSNNVEYGTVTPASQVVASGATAQVTASAKSGYVIESWTGADSYTGIGSQSGVATVNNVKANKTIRCNFKTSVIQTGGLKAVISFGETVSEFDSVNRVSKNKTYGTLKPFFGVDGKMFGTVCMDRFQLSKTIVDPICGVNTGNNSGDYPDIYMSSMISPYKEESDFYGSLLLVIPAGNYKLRLFASINNETAVVDALSYSILDDVKQVGLSVVNNTTEWLEWSIISDGTSTIELIATQGARYKWAPVNIIEIIEV